jgi:hypothetical protein
MLPLAISKMNTIYMIPGEENTQIQKCLHGIMHKTNTAALIIFWSQKTY